MHVQRLQILLGLGLMAVSATAGLAQRPEPAAPTLPAPAAAPALSGAPALPAPPASPAPPAEPFAIIAPIDFGEESLRRFDSLDPSILELEQLGDLAISETEALDEAWEFAYAGLQVAPSRSPKALAKALAGKKRSSEERAESRYERGSDALARRQWERAAGLFQDVIDAKARRADGAIYWKAYALNRLGKPEEALSALQQLERQFPNSRWKEDARVLSAEVKRADGQPMSPEEQADEEIKLYALDGLASSDPERALPILQNLLSQSNSPRLKERALFVLARTDSPKAYELLAKYARGASNPDLQIKAIEYLGIARGEKSRELLAELYSTLSDPDARGAVLRSLMLARDKDHLLAVVRTEKDQDLLSRAIRYLGSLGAGGELAGLYSQQSSAEVKSAVIDGLFRAKQADALLNIARNETDSRLKIEAVRRAGLLRDEKTAAALRTFYQAEQDRGVKEAALAGMCFQRDYNSVIEVARTDKDLELRKAAVQCLSRSDSKAAKDYLMEILSK